MNGNQIIGSALAVAGGLVTFYNEHPMSRDTVKANASFIDYRNSQIGANAGSPEKYVFQDNALRIGSIAVCVFGCLLFFAD